MKVFLIATLLAGASALDENCWQKMENMYMPCHAKERSEEGTLADKANECIELEGDCRGVTCNAEGDSCTVRHHRHCEGGDFLKESTSMEVTYVKICEVSKHVWEQHDDQYIPCYAKADENAGALLERKMRCAELGNECIGVTCKYDDPADKVGSAKDCTVRDHRMGCQGEQALVNSGEEHEVSFTMDVTTNAPGKPTPPPVPFGEDCTFETTDAATFTCNTPKPTDQRHTLAAAKEKCKKMKDTNNFCNGIVCDNKDPNAESCVVHKHCVSEGQEMLKDATSVVHIKTCAEGDWCMTPCHPAIEFKGHVCKSDCDCAGLRSCSAQGYCQDPVGLSASEELCIDSSDCLFEKYENKYMPCESAALVNKGVLSLKDAQRECTNMLGSCAGITCKGDECQLRNNLLETCEVKGLKVSKSGEDTYLKCCGPEKELRCPGFSGSSSSNSHTGVLVFLVIVLLGAVGFLAYKKHQMEKDYVAPNEFNAVPQDDEADNNWVIDDTKEDDQ